MKFDYFYGAQAEQFSFYRIPRILIKDPRFKKLSSDAKILYGLMLDRVSLSMKNGWIDEEGRAYIYFTIEDVMEELNCSKPTGVKIVAELDVKKGIGLIEKIRQGLGKPDLIYVKDFTSREGESDKDESLTNDELPEVKNFNFRKSDKFTSDSSDSLPSGVMDSDLKKLKNFTSVSKENELAEVKSVNSNYTEYNHTEENQTQSINPSARQSIRENFSVRFAEEMDRMDGNVRGISAALISLVKNNIEYDHHMTYDPDGQKEIYDELFQVIMDTLLGGAETIRIGEALYPYDVVRSRLLKLTSSHLTYVRDRISNTPGEIRNMKKYMLAALYNASATMDTYYTQRVHHDMYSDTQETA